MIADELISFLLEKYKRESNNDNLKEVLDTNLNDEDSKIADLYINLSKAKEPKDINKWADEILKMYPDDIDVQFSKIIANFVSAKDFQEKILKLENKYKDEFYKINNISEAFLENKPLNLFENVANRPYLRLLVQIGLTSFYNHDTEQAYEYFTKVYNFAPNLIEQFSLQYGLACVALNKEDQLNKIYEILPNNYGLRLSHAINTFLKDHKLEALKSELDELNPYLSIIFSRGLDISEDDFNYCCSLNPYLKGSITEAIHTYNDIFMLCDGKICDEIVDAFDKRNPPSTILDLFNENDGIVFARFLALFDNDDLVSFSYDDFLNGCLGKPCEDKKVEEMLSKFDKLTDEKMVEESFNKFVSLSLLQRDEDKKFRFTETTIIFYNTFLNYFKESA